MLSPDPGPTRPDPRPRRPLWLPAVALLACAAVAAVGWWFAPDLTSPDPPLELQPLPPPLMGGASPAEIERLWATAARDLAEPVPAETPSGRNVGFDRRLDMWASGRRLLFADPDRLTVLGPDPVEYTAAALTGGPRAVLDPRTATVSPDGRRVAVFDLEHPLPVWPSRDPWPKNSRLLVLDLWTGTIDRPALTAKGEVHLYGAVSDGIDGSLMPHWLGDSAFLVKAVEWTPTGRPGGESEPKYRTLRYETGRPGTLREVAGLPTDPHWLYADRPGRVLVKTHDPLPEPRPSDRAGFTARVYWLDADGLRPAGPEELARVNDIEAAEQARSRANQRSNSHRFVSHGFGHTAGPHRVGHDLWPAVPGDPREDRFVEVLRLNGRLVRRLRARKCAFYNSSDPLISEVRWDADLGLYRWLEREPDGHRYDTFVSDAAGHVRRWHSGRYVGPVAPVPRP